MPAMIEAAPALSSPSMPRAIAFMPEEISVVMAMVTLHSP